MRIRLSLYAAALTLLAFGAAGCLEKLPEELNEPVPSIPTPTDLSAVSRDGGATISWSFDQSFQFESFKIYRSDDDRATWQKVGTTAAPPYDDSNLRNGIIYWYRVSGVSVDGLEGRPSGELPVMANAFGVVINDGAEFTSSRMVTLRFAAPTQTQSVVFSEDSLFQGALREAYNPTYPFELSGTDGVKRVYAEFKDALGNVSGKVSDSIVLDTHAAIDSLSFSPAGPFAPGASIHFRVVSKGREADGYALITIGGVAGPIYAMDDGGNGDSQAGDGVCERDYVFMQSFRGTGIRASAVFIDAAGNESDAMEFPGEIDFTDPPQAVYLFPAVDSTTSSITLRWSQSQDQHFSDYAVYRSESAQVSEDSSLRVGLVYDKATQEWTDTGLDEAKTYYYRVYVENDLGETQGSNVRAARTLDLPPEPVVCDPLSSVGNGRATVTWSVNNDSDFLAYYVYRDTIPGVTETTGTMVSPVITDRYTTFFDDSGLDLLNHTYYYRVYVYDKGGNKARSNEVATQ
jgi:fibronectin type 3 domain-containing protein